MDLQTVWNDLDEDCQRVIRTVANPDRMLEGEDVLGAIARLERPVGELLESLNRDHELGLSVPDRLEPPGEEPPEDVVLSAHMRETLNFFRIHRLRPIRPESLALRLLQMSSGDVDRKLEATGRFQEILADLEVLADNAGTNPPG